MSIRYTEEHEWLRKEDDVVVVGISQYAVEQLGDVVFVELPPVDSTYGENADCAVVESVKAASDVYCPIAGKIVEVNPILLDDPETVNREPLENGWFFKMVPDDWDDLDKLMTEEQYQEFIS
jgi:glycine cleavage system H protein